MKIPRSSLGPAYSPPTDVIKKYQNNGNKNINYLLIMYVVTNPV